ncbi:TspO/MBR family protein [Acuticoccus sp. MNP-M23]|uniref:TspO/MBR family protein n=1 Tax=Acuticoccus sp. MNP-M23 TaxID=3072793 RepID=UPI0028149A13|nr:TspO/MBR family protein [Acuticoccus sp. MNP-M23]WMS42151.1 TspO/MBR family protein [Acuticoccus sp. MNP-M23]
MENWTLFLVFIGVNVLAASSGAFFMPGAWYRALNKPPWTPPDWLFGPAWTLLFLMIAYAGYRFTVDAAPGERTVPLMLYGLQLVANAGWSALFFGARRVDLALADAILMFVTIAATILAFYPHSPIAAYLMVPYLLWVGFASALNYSIMRRNAS